MYILFKQQFLEVERVLRRFELRKYNRGTGN